jgi:FAD/FMN-containing dehydrogenase
MAGAVQDNMTEGFMSGLAHYVGDDNVIVAPDVRASYETDWTRRWHGRCIAVVRPADAAQASEVLQMCGDRGVRIVPQGGNTGLVGGATPRGSAPQIVLSSARLTKIGDVDRGAGQVTVGAGVTVAALQRTARTCGFEAGLDLGARDTATVGGVAACDAGGLQAMRYGTARRRIVGLEAVLADGTIVRRLAGLPKDNAGYNVPALLVGSEGTLGFITQVRWSCVSRKEARVVVLIAVESVSEAVAMATSLRWGVPSVEMIELLTETGIRLLGDRLSAPLPVPPAPAWVLVECADSVDPSERLIEVLSDLGVGERSAFAVDASSRRRLLRLREALPELITQDGISHKLDVGVPLDSLSAFYDELRQLVRERSPSHRLIVFGHLGDGNVHVNILGPDPDDEAVDAAVFELVAEHGGTISAEHGVGVLKARFLPLVRSAGELRMMRLIKQALDPASILNPNVVLEEE